jgi:DNA-binding PadR family transcriptional regulator
MDERLGGFEELVLLAVAGLRGSGYGVTIQEQLEAETGRTVAVGAVYATLERLERKGYLRSRVGPATAERGGRRKRLYQVTAAGVATLEATRRIRVSLWRAIETTARP